MVPENLQRWADWANRLRTADLRQRSEFDRVVAELPPGVIDELSTFYAEALRRDDIAPLSAWLREAGGGPSPDPDELGVRNLFHLFTRLGRRGYVPFGSVSLQLDRLPPARLDWSKLPPDLAFLKDTALAVADYAYVFSEAGREHVAATMPEPMRSMLARAAEQVRQAGYPRVKAWHSGLGVGEHREASLVFNLLGVMDALDLDYCD